MKPLNDLHLPGNLITFMDIKMMEKIVRNWTHGLISTPSQMTSQRENFTRFYIPYQTGIPLDHYKYHTRAVLFILSIAVVGK